MLMKKIIFLYVLAILPCAYIIAVDNTSQPTPTKDTNSHTPTDTNIDSIQTQNTESLQTLDTQDSLAQPQESHAPEFDNEGFITFKEYGKNLYENPRGIGCHHCHGQKGEGSIIAHYTHKGNAKTLSAPAVNKLEFSVFAKALDSQKIGVMPRYYLTQKEIQAIYFYLYE